MCSPGAKVAWQAPEQAGATRWTRGAGAAEWRDRVPVGPGPQLGFPIPEAKYFGEVCGTEDMRIGVDNFIKNGPKVKATFVHR